MNPRSYYEYHAKVNANYQYNNKRMDYCNRCDSDSSCEDIRYLCGGEVPLCPEGIHCMKPHCVYQHPHARNNPMSMYQTIHMPMSVAPNPYPPYTPNQYPQSPNWGGPTTSNIMPQSSNWAPTSTIMPHSGTWPNLPPRPSYGTSLPSSTQLYPQPATISTPRPSPLPPPSINMSQTIQPNYVKMPELPKKSTPGPNLSMQPSLGMMSNTRIEARPSISSSSNAPYPVERPMPQPRKPPTNPMTTDNIMQMPQPRKPTTSFMPVKAIPTEIDHVRMGLEQLNPYQTPRQSSSYNLPQPLPQAPKFPVRAGSLSQKPNNLPPLAPVIEPAAPAPVTSQTRKDESSDENLCCICLENKPEIVLIPCGHTKFCQECSDLLKECPICRSKIVMKQKIFL